jgi:hypothetical protein
MRYCFVLLCLWAVVGTVSAQKMLKLDTRHQAGKMTFVVGSYITYHIEGEPENNWRTDRIQDMDIERNAIQLEYGWLKIQEISAVRNPNRNPKLRVFGKTLQAFSIVATFYSLIAVALDKPVKMFAEAGGAFVLGSLFDCWGGRKTYKIRNKTRLRLLDPSDWKSVPKV